MKILWRLPALLFATASLAQTPGVFWRDEITGTNISSSSPYGASGSVNTANRFVATGLTVAGISKSSGLTASTVNNGFKATSWGTRAVVGGAGGVVQYTMNLDDYFEFSLMPGTSGYLLFDEFKFVGDPDEQGPRNFELRSSTNDFANHIVITSFTRSNDDAFTQIISLAGALPNTITIPIKFRLYGWRAADDNGGSFEIQRFEFSGTSSLPVRFGTIEAVQKSDQVNIKWTTLKETNNSHFEIEASTDGKAFTTVKTVQSKNGSSDTQQNYEVSIAASDVASLLGLPALLSLLSLGFSRRKRLAAGAVALVMLGVNFIGCSKQGDAIDVNTIDKVFMRIKQVDKDGAFQYSDVIQVIKK